MLKRLKVWTYAAGLIAFSALAMGCGWGGGSFFNMFYNTKIDSWTRILTAIVREELFS